MSESFTTDEKVAIFDRLYSYLTDPMGHDNQLVERELEKTKADNTKLRELVRDMMLAWWACDNEVCPRHDERCEKGNYCAFDECAQELGIEVEE